VLKNKFNFTSAVIRSIDLVLFEGDARGVYLFDCSLTRVLNAIKRSKSRIKLNANTSVDVLLKLSKAHLKMAIVWVSKYA